MRRPSNSTGRTDGYGGLARQAMLLRRLRKLDSRGAVDVTRLLTGTIADLVDRYFAADATRCCRCPG